MSALGQALHRLAMHVAVAGTGRHPALVRRAWEALETKRWEDARFFAEAAVRSDPTAGDGYRLLGYALLRTGAIDKARLVYQSGIRAAPADSSLLVALGDLELEAGRYTEADKAYRYADQLTPNRADLVLRLGKSALIQGRIPEAAELLERAMGLDPDNPEVLLSLGSARRRLGDFDGAVRVLAPATVRVPGSSAAHYDLAVSLAALAQWEAALVHATSALNLEPDNLELQKLVRIVDAHQLSRDKA